MADVEGWNQPSQEVGNAPILAYATISIDYFNGIAGFISDPFAMAICELEIFKGLRRFTVLQQLVYGNTINLFWTSWNLL